MSSPPFILYCGEGVVAGGLGQVAGVVDGEDADVAAAADLEAVDAAVRRHDPGRLLGVAADGAHQVEREEADGTRVREDRDPPARVVSQDFPKLGGAAFEQVLVALAVGDDVVDLAVDEGVIVVGEGGLGFVERQAFQHADVALAERRRGHDRDARQFRERLGRLHGTQQIARIYDRNSFLRQHLRRHFGLFSAQLGERRRTMPAETPFGVAGGLSVSDQK